MFIGLTVGLSQPAPVASGPVLGPELVVNGDMSSDAGWTLIGDATPVISGGKMTFTSPDGSSGEADQAPSLAVATYRLAFTIDSITGDGAGLTGVVGNGPGTQRTTAGMFTQDIASDGSDSLQLFFASSGVDEAIIVIDNVSLKQVL